MSEISSLSLTTQIDSLAQQFRTAQRKPIVALENKKTTFTARLNALADLKAKLNTLFLTAKELSLSGSSSKFFVYSVTSTLPNIVTGSASSHAFSGVHTLLVKQLARSDTVLSSQLTKSSTSVVENEGIGVKTIRVMTGGVGTDLNITLEGEDSNATVLSKIAGAVNSANVGVSASVVSDTATSSRLVFTSRQAGSSNAISLADVTGTLLTNIGLTEEIISNRTGSSSTSAGFLHTSVSALNAVFIIDGIELIRETNSVTDALQGVTLELKGTQNELDHPATLVIGVDREKIKTSIQKFIKDYNDALAFLTAKTSVDPGLKIRQIFAGDLIFTNLRVNLRATVGGEVGSISPGNPSLLASVGITMNSDGTLMLSDPAAFDEALSQGVEKVSDLFNSADGIATRLKSVLDGFVSNGGQIDTTRKSVNSQLDALKTRIKRLDEEVNRKVERFRSDFARLQSLVASAARQQQTIQNLLFFRPF